MSRITRRELILGGAGATILGVTAAHSENVMLSIGADAMDERVVR